MISYICVINKNVLKNKKNILTIVLVLVAAIVLALAIYYIQKSYSSKTDGTIQVTLVDLDGSIVSDKKIAFKKGDMLQELIADNYENVVFNDGMIMSIESFQTPLDWSVFICIYVDGKMSEKGLNDIVFENGTHIEFKLTEFIYE